MTGTDPTATATVVAASPGTSVQDLGRPGYMHIGVSPSGAADMRSFTMANRLVGNPESAACFEVLLGGLSLTLSSDRMVAVTGAPVPVQLDGRMVRDPSRMLVPAGARLDLGRPAEGVRTYLAVAGGVEAARFLGSAADDVLGGIGSGPVETGQTYALGRPVHCPDLPTDLAVSRIPTAAAVLPMYWGPRHDLFDAADRHRLISQRWQVSDRIDRVAARLIGDPLTIGSVALPSEGMVRGSIEVPPSGEPIVFLADHPATGGYPVIGVLAEAAADLLAQARPGLAVRFDPVVFP